MTTSRQRTIEAGRGLAYCVGAPGVEEGEYRPRMIPYAA